MFLSRRTITASILGLAVFALALAGRPAAAEQPLGSAEILYDFNLAGVPIAQMTISAAFNDGSYRVNGHGKTVGLVDIFSKIRFSGAAEGNIVKGAPRPKTHNYNYSERGKARRVSIIYDDALKPLVVANPEFGKPYDRVPLPADKLVGTIDLVSQFISPAFADLAVLDPGPCAREFSVFDGRLRVDATVSHRKSYPNSALRGMRYKGPLMHCAVRIRPVGGHKEGDMLSKVAHKGDTDVWVAPVLGGRFYIPVRVRIPTPFGTAELVSRKLRATPATAQQKAGLGG